MNTIRNYRDPHNPYWRYRVTLDRQEYLGATRKDFANLTALWDWIEAEHPGEVFDCQILGFYVEFKKISGDPPAVFSEGGPLYISVQKIVSDEPPRFVPDTEEARGAARKD